MVPSVERKYQRDGVGRRQRFTDLRIATQLGIILGMVLLFIGSATAQLESTRVELVAQTASDEALFHVRVLRGQTIESAEVTQGDNTLTLETEPVPLPITQWIVIDASEEMVNLQAAVLQAVQRFLRNDTNQNGLITFNSRVNVLRPTDRVSQIDNFLADYTATAGEPACIESALEQINEVERNFDRTWRILVITAADFSQESRCSDTTMPTLPAPVDIIAVTDEIPQKLNDLVNTSGGNILTANLRTVEARVNEVRTQWGQPSYALSAPLPDDWDSDEPMQLTVTLSNGTEETTEVMFRAYNVPPPPAPTVAPTEVVLETIPTRAVEPTVASEDTNETVLIPEAAEDEPSSSGNVAFLLIIGAVLFIVGAVVLALAMSRVRRAPYTQATSTPSQNFYDSLADDDEGSGGVLATKIRERNLVEDQDVGVTQISDNIAPAIDADEPDTRTFTQEDAEDELIITQVLSDQRFQSMMRQSNDDTEIVAFLRLEGMAEGDFALYQRGAMIGRSQDCDIQITGDRAISRQHAKLEVQDNGIVTISRLSATNPVVVGGVNVANRHPLKTNDVIHLTDMTRLVFIANVDEDFDEETTLI